MNVGISKASEYVIRVLFMSFKGGGGGASENPGGVALLLVTLRRTSKALVPKVNVNNVAIINSS